MRKDGRKLARILGILIGVWRIDTGEVLYDFMTEEKEWNRRE